MSAILKEGEAENLLAKELAGELPDERGRFGPFGSRMAIHCSSSDGTP